MKTSLTKVGIMVAAVALTGGFTACKKKGCTDNKANNYDSKAKKDDGSCTYDALASNEVSLKGTIETSTTWTADKIWVLDGKVVVKSGTTLTIEPGTIIKGKEGDGAAASALVVPRGAKINAVGTEAKPIIFTSVLDNIKVGETTGTSLTTTDKGKWGGVIILGNAKISAKDGDTESQIEGIPASESYGKYGGNDDNDDSGKLKYVSIRHGGVSIGAGNEINGLTLGGVGNKTEISNIEVVANLDDGIEFFGGSVNADNVLIAYVGDDALDIDQSYSGTISNFIVIADTDSDKGLEIDGTEGVTNNGGLFTLKDGYLYSKDGAGSGAAADLKDKAQGTISNVKFENFPSSNKLKVRASYQNDCADVKTDACSNLIDSPAKLTISGCELGGIEVYTGSKNDAATDNCTVQPADQTDAAAAVTSTSVSAIANTSFSWGWVGKNNKF